MEDLVKAICDELTLCYESAGRKSPESLMVVAASHAEAIDFKDRRHVHEAFKRARDIEPIPTQKTLKECARNYSEEVLKYEGVDSRYAKLEYFDPRSPWLPEEPTKRRVNRQEAIKRYCIAHSDEMYRDYCKIHATVERHAGAEEIVSWAMPGKVKDFDDAVAGHLTAMYDKYLRYTPVYKNFPRESSLSLEMIPPSVRELRIMFQQEQKSETI